MGDALDPTFAAAYAGVADCYAHLGFTPYSTMAPGEAYPRAKAVAEAKRAIDVDPHSANAADRREDFVDA